jgi:hypothetical protein
MRSSYEEEGRRKLLLKSTWSTVSGGVKCISDSQNFGQDGGEDFFNGIGQQATSRA